MARLDRRAAGTAVKPIAGQRRRGVPALRGSDCCDRGGQSIRSELQEIYGRAGTKAASAEGAGAINQEEVGHVGSAGCRSTVAPPP